MDPTVSVIIPAYNAEDFIREAIQSVLHQTVHPAEIIVVDDGSTDATAEVVHSFEGAVPGIRYLHQGNSGVSVARNLGLDVASGDLIAFLDADDRWRPNMIERQVELLETDPALTCAITNFERFEHSSGRVTGDQFTYYPELAAVTTRSGPPSPFLLVQGDPFSKLISFTEIPGYTQVAMLRRVHVEGLRFAPALRRNEDLEFMARVFMRGKVAFNPEVLAEVRRHGDNATNDVRSLEVGKYEALRSLRDHVTGTERVHAYHGRLIRAHLDVARYHLEAGKPGEALGMFRRGMGVPGGAKRKLRGGIRLASELVISTLRGFQPASRTD